MSEELEELQTTLFVEIKKRTIHRTKGFDNILRKLLRKYTRSVLRLKPCVSCGKPTEELCTECLEWGRGIIGKYPPPLPKEPVGNVEAIAILHAYPDGEVFAVVNDWKGDPRLFAAKRNGSLWCANEGVNNWSNYIAEEMGFDLISLVPRSEVPEAVVEALSEDQAG